jgi:hypothetical protein
VNEERQFCHITSNSNLKVKVIRKMLANLQLLGYFLTIPRPQSNSLHSVGIHVKDTTHVGGHLYERSLTSCLQLNVLKSCTQLKKIRVKANRSYTYISHNFRSLAR